MPSRRLLTTAVLLAALSAPGPASAAPAHVAPASTPAPPRATALLGAAFEAGLMHWGALPCGGDVKVLAHRGLTPGMATDTDAWVTFTSSLGPNDLHAPASSYRGCVIFLGRARWPTPASMQEDWEVLCTTMTHELGHLLGYAHDAAPGSVMAPVITDATEVPGECRAASPGGSGATRTTPRSVQEPRSPHTAERARPVLRSSRS